MPYKYAPIPFDINLFRKCSQLVMHVNMLLYHAMFVQFWRKIVMTMQFKLELR